MTECPGDDAVISLKIAVPSFEVSDTDGNISAKTWLLGDNKRHFSSILTKPSAVDYRRLYDKYI
jgi:hypothetical protein